LSILQGNIKSQFHASLLAHAQKGRALDAISDGWEMLDFRASDSMSDQELAVWDQVADHSSAKPALSSQASPGSFATAVISMRGTLVSVDPNFGLWLGSAEMAVTLKDMRDLSRLARSGRQARRLLTDRDGRPILVAGLERHVGLRWPLSLSAKQALLSDEATICLVAFAPTRSDALFETVKTVFRLSSSEAKLAIALLHHDSLEEAADAIGITEMTANGYRKALFKKMGVKRRSELVQMILEVGHRERCNDSAADSLALQSMFALNKDQMAVLDALAVGLTMPEVAKKLNINIHTARDHVRTMFEQIGVNKQSELVRVALEYRALVTLSEASEVNANPVNDLLAYTRVIARPSGGLVYLADYGPRDGAVVLMFHAGLGTRRIASNFLKAAAANGLRILCIERPGFGGTDLRDEAGFEGSSLDALMVLDKLEIDKAVICSIAGGNIAALSFAAAYPERVMGGLLINPAPPKGHKSKLGAPATAFQQMAFANPTIIRAMAKAMRNQMRTDLLDPLLDKYFSTCAADRRAMADPEIRAMQRASTQAAIARTVEGFVREEEAFARNWQIPELACGPWTIAVGTDDHTCDPETANAIWRALPGFSYVDVHEAGRMIIVSRPDILVACLAALAKGRPMPRDTAIKSAA
jgi:DNA-binding CsgD family transcriptional regulator/pimeloyl-ACP methyl ester carboxylesterase